MLWTPPDDCWDTTAFGRFAAECGFARDADGLLAWSIAHGDDFWRAVTAFTGLRWMRPPDAIREGDTMPGVRWFPGATLNFADQALASAGALGDVVAVVAESQTRGRIELTWSELADLVRRCAAGLRRLGVGPGVRVVAYAPNIPETLVAFLATASLGAVWSSCAPEFGVRAVIDRFGQIEPHVLVAIDGYQYGARDIDRREQVAEVVAALGTVAHVVHVPYRDPAARPAFGGRVAVHVWDELVADADGDADLHSRRRRPPAVRALQLGHHRVAQGDRARPRRDRRRAPQGDAAAQRPRSGQALLLVHHHRVDDVELPGVGAADRRHDRAVRR